MIRAISFDAAGTLIRLSEPVGYGYSRVAERFGIQLEPEKTTQAFKEAWKKQGPPVYPNGPSRDDDRAWWRSLVDRVLDLTLGSRIPPGTARTEIFEALYAHYAKPESWSLFPEVKPVLERLSATGLRLIILSNFDPRLRGILSEHGIDTHFHEIVISSEVGFYKPDPAIFACASAAAGHPPEHCLHVGDDHGADIAGGRAARFKTVHITRPETTLESLFDILDFPT